MKRTLFFMGLLLGVFYSSALWMHSHSTSTGEISATELLWEFFEQHPKP